MAKTKKKNKSFWFIVGLLGVLLSAPNATVVKYGIGDLNPYLFNTLRFTLIAAITTPYLITRLSKFTKKNRKHVLMAGMYMSAAVISFVWAIKLSQASYVSVILLLSPIFFILLSARMTGEKITARSAAGITLAAIGAAVIVFLPISLEQKGEFTFYPLASLFALINTITFPLAIITYKKANDAGLPMVAIMSASSWIVALINTAFWLVAGGAVVTLSGSAYVGILYSGIAVALVGRSLNVASYERIGSAATSALGYVEILLSILLPVLFLNETLSVEIIIGGVLILVGVYIVEHHKSTHHRHFLMHKH